MLIAGAHHSLVVPVPVELAYGITIHRAQGQTYDRVAVVGTNIFAPGQAYTAISRCRTLAGLYCIDVIPDHYEIPWPPEISAFVEKLQAA